MTTPPPPQPKIRSIVLGVLVVALLVVVVCSASSIVKWAGMPFLVLPRVAGLLQGVRSEEIVALPMASSPTAVTFPRPERYAVYTGDVNLLEMTAGVRASDSLPWLAVQQADSGRAIPVSFVGRGLMPYDEPRAPGRPVFTFEITEPGMYALSHPRREFAVYLVPDRTTGKEGLIAAVFLAQLALLALPFLILIGRPWIERRKMWRKHQQERRQASDSILRRRAGRRSP